MRKSSDTPILSRCPKTPAFAVVRFDDFLTEVSPAIDMQLKVVKVFLDGDTAQAEAEPLNELREGKGVRYWVSAARLVTPG